MVYEYNWGEAAGKWFDDIVRYHYEMPFYVSIPIVILYGLAIYTIYDYYKNDDKDNKNDKNGNNRQEERKDGVTLSFQPSEATKQTENGLQLERSDPGSGYSTLPAVTNNQQRRKGEKG